MTIPTPPESFETMVDEVLDDVISAAVMHVEKMKEPGYDFKYINERYTEAKTALLAAHQRAVIEARIEEQEMYGQIPPDYGDVIVFRRNRIAELRAALPPKFTVPTKAIYEETLTMNGKVVETRLVEREIPPTLEEGEK